MTAAQPPSKETRICHNDDEFAKVRKKLGIEDDFLESWLDYSKLSAGGGKGGDALYASPDRRYMMKEVNGGDQKSLLAYAKDLCSHYLGGKTILCPVLIHFTEQTQDGKNYIVMSLILPVAGPYESLYDLKGCQDDKTLELEGAKIKEVHKRIWNCSMWCGSGNWSEARKIYYKGKKDAHDIKIKMAPTDANNFSEALSRDCKFFSNFNLMDYSLLIATKVVSKDEFDMSNTCTYKKTISLNLTHVFVTPVEDDNNSLRITYLGIIDYLQEWNASKRAANIIKCMEKNKPTIPPKAYAKRFERHFNDALVIKDKYEMALEKPTGDADDAVIDGGDGVDPGDIIDVTDIVDGGDIQINIEEPEEPAN